VQLTTSPISKVKCFISWWPANTNCKCPPLSRGAAHIIPECFSQDTCTSPKRICLLPSHLRGAQLAWSGDEAAGTRLIQTLLRKAQTLDKVRLSWLLLVRATDRKWQSRHIGWKLYLSGGTDSVSGTHIGRQQLQTQLDFFY